MSVNSKYKKKIFPSTASAIYNDYSIPRLEIILYISYPIGQLT